MVSSECMIAHDYFARTKLKETSKIIKICIYDLYKRRYFDSCLNDEMMSNLSLKTKLKMAVNIIFIETPVNFPAF